MNLKPTLVLTTVTLCSVASQTVCSGASSRSKTRQRDSSPALVDVTTLLQCWGNSTGCRSDNESTLSWPSWSIRHFMLQRQHNCAGYDRPTSTRAVSHGPTHASATRALQPLDRGFGTVCRPGFASPTRHWRISSAAKVVFVQVTPRRTVTFWFYAPSNILTHSLTHSLTVIHCICWFVSKLVREQVLVPNIVQWLQQTTNKKWHMVK